MVNYQNTKIYKIESHLGPKIYIGSTTKQYLSQRMDTHRGNYKQWKKGNGGNVSSYILFDEYGLENCNILLLESYPCNSKDEKAAKEAGYEIKIGKFPFSASGKASAAGAKDGFVKLIFDAKYGELLGGHMIGANVTEMVAELVAVRKLESTGEELIKTVHPHPTMSEAIMEAAAAAYGEVIHL